MAINFPTSPTNGQTFTSGNLTWSYSSSVGAWEIVPIGSTGGGGASNGKSIIISMIFGR